LPLAQSLSKKERLKSYQKIRQLFEKGERFRQPPLLVYYVISKEASDEKVGDPLQMGVSVGARSFKKAVDRNLLKRRIREAYRKQKQDLREMLLAKGLSMGVFFVFTNTSISEYAEIELAMKSALKKLCSINSN